MKIFKKNFYLILLFFLIIFFLSEILPLSGDEAYYYDCSKNLDWSYFDQPPLPIWLSGIFSSIYHSNLSVRFPSIFFTILTLILIYKWVGSRGINLFLILSSAPLLFFGSFYLSTDKPLSFFYLWSTILLIKIYQKSSNFLWFLIGISFGMGILSKFPMVLIFPLIFYIAYRRANLLQFFIFSVVSLLISLPIFIYGYENNWINFTFQLALRHKESSNFFKMFLNLWLPNLILMGPFFFTRGLYLAFKDYKKEKILFISGLIPLLFFTLAGFKNPGAPHWLGLGFLPLALLQFENWDKKITKISVFINILIVSFIILLLIFPSYFYKFRPETFKNFIDFNIIKEEILKEREKGEVLISQSYTIVALLNYHLKNEDRVYLFNIDRGVHGLSYLYWQKNIKFEENNYLLISNKRLKEKSLLPYFKSIILKEVIIKDKNLSKKIYLYHCRDIKNRNPFYPF